VLDRTPQASTRSGAPGQTLADVERAHVLAVLETTGGNRARAAKILEISPTTLWRKLKAWDQQS
jgi:transcriptional regulator with PAS, ATPase and Fis domain